MENLYAKVKQEYCSRTEKSYEMFIKAKKSMPGGDTRTTSYHFPYPLTIHHARGFTLEDVDGNKYIDFLSNYTAVIHGHSHPYITEKVQKVLQSGNCYGTIISEQIGLADLLCERLPTLEKIRFCNSGTEATMFAIRAARAFTGRTGVIKMRGGYHGTHDIASYSSPSSPGIPSGVAEDIYEATFNDAASIESILQKNKGEIACIIVEPVLGAGGIISAEREFLQSLRKLADQHGVLLIFDEIMTLRLNKGGAQTIHNVKPDLTTLAKIIGGGFPIGAFGGRKDIMEQFNPTREKFMSHGGTYNGNRIAMAAGIASMQLLTDSAIKHINYLGSMLQKGMEQAIRDYALPISVTRAGSLLNVHFNGTKPTTYNQGDQESTIFNRTMHLNLLNKGIFTAPRGLWCISTIMSEKEINKAISSFAETLGMVSERIN